MKGAESLQRLQLNTYDKFMMKNSLTLFTINCSFPLLCLAFQYMMRDQLYLTLGFSGGKTSSPKVLAFLRENRGAGNAELIHLRLR